jgi:putative selenate reductase molybdopterin-binding subunit
MQIKITINGEKKTLTIEPHERLLRVLRREGYFSVKFGDEHGISGADTVLLDGQVVNAQTILAAQADGHHITTVEDIGGSRDLHVLQQAFIDTGAIQSGYCTPAQVVAACSLLHRTLNPTEDEIREAISGILDRETGYVKVVQAIQRAAAKMRGEDVEPFDLQDIVHSPPDLKKTNTIGKPEAKVDGVKLAAGNAVFSDDVEMRGMLHAAMLTSPHAHARIVSINASKARELAGVHAVLTYEDVPRVYYASGGQTYPNPLPYDQVSLDNKVRHVGDRVAIVAAETQDIANEALDLINVEYDVLPAVLDMEDAMKDGAPVVHDDPNVEGIHDAKHNIVHHVDAAGGDADAQWSKADHIFEGEYRVHQVQHCHTEPHVCVTWWDEDDRLTIRTSTQVPFHVRRMVAPLIGLPIKRIRVIKPRVGGAFGGKQEMLIEDLCAHLTIATGQPVRFEYTREQEFISSRSRHPQIIRIKTGVTNDGEIVACEMHTIANTGAYGTHGLTVQMVSGFRGLTTYNAPYSRFVCDVIYTNVPPPGAYRGYGAPQGLHAIEVHTEEIAQALGMDLIEFKHKNWIKQDEPLIMAVALGEGREGMPQVVTTSALEECVEIGMKAVEWHEKRGKKRHVPDKPHLKRGIGMSVVMHGTGIAGLDMGAASIKLNDDGSFNLNFGATDLGTGSDTILAQIAAETLGVPVDDIIVYAADTDMTPFDTGAYASSTTYISGGAVLKASEQIKTQILEHVAGRMLDCDITDLELDDRQVVHKDGGSVSLQKVALHSLHQDDQHQIMASASHMSEVSPPPFAAQFVEVIVDTQTGQVTVERLSFAVDCGMVINPITASGQVEGGMVQALGWAHCEEMPYDENGRLLATDLGEYHTYRADEMPEMDIVFVETYEPSGPYGAKAVAEIPKDGVAPAISSAIFDATGVRMRDLPFTPERVWRALKTS